MRLQGNCVSEASDPMQPMARPIRRRERRRLNGRRLLLAAGLGLPVLGGILVAVAMLAHPEFNHARQYISELGAHGENAAALFNLGLVLVGLGIILAGLGNYLALAAIGARKGSAAIVALLFALAGAGMALSALIPWPDPRHHLAVQLGLGLGACPVLLVWSLSGIEGVAGLRRFLILTELTILGLIMVSDHLFWPHLVNDLNVGWWESALAITLSGWVMIFDLALDRRLVHQPLNPHTT